MISIIVPVYNTGKKLERCINSLLKQSYENIEIIIVDDGSTDRETIELCSKYKSTDTRMKVFRRQNSGVSSTRNFGIFQAKGIYLMFVDSDDYIKSTTCMELRMSLHEANSTTSLCGFSRDFYKNNKLIRSNIVNPDCESLVNEFDFEREFGQLYEKTLLVSVWAKLYDMNIIKKHNIRFNENINLGEDMLFNFDYFKITKNISICNKSLYHYICDETMSLTSKVDLDKNKATKLLFQSSLQFIDECSIENNSESIIAKIYLRGCFRNIESIFSKSCSLSKQEKSIYINSIKSDEWTRRALEVKAFDREHKIYKLILKMNYSWFITTFAYLRLLYKRKVRGG
jgi:glycosyltransferase involved in cell wall biosynthesis